MKKFSVSISYPVCGVVEAMTQEEAEEKALNSADDWLQSGIKPFITDVSEEQENGDWIDLIPGLYE